MVQNECGESQFDFWGKVVPASIGKMLPSVSCVPIKLKFKMKSRTANVLRLVLVAAPAGVSAQENDGDGIPWRRWLSLINPARMFEGDRQCVSCLQDVYECELADQVDAEVATAMNYAEEYITAPTFELEYKRTT